MLLSLLHVWPATETPFVTLPYETEHTFRQRKLANFVVRGCAHTREYKYIYDLNVQKQSKYKQIWMVRIRKILIVLIVL